MGTYKISDDQVIAYAFRNTKPNESDLIAEGRMTMNPTDSSPRYSINLSDILTKLIQDTGRFCMRFANDLLVDIDTITKAIEDPDNNGVYAIAIRESGVDGNGYVRGQMMNSVWNSDYYRCIYGIAINHTDDGVIVTMRNIRDEINTIAYHIERWIIPDKEKALYDLINKEPDADTTNN